MHRVGAANGSVLSALLTTSRSVWATIVVVSLAALLPATGSVVVLVPVAVFVRTPAAAADDGTVTSTVSTVLAPLASDPIVHVTVPASSLLLTPPVELL